MEILNESDRRFKYANKLVKKLKIMETLEKYGEPLLIGSLAKGTYWKRDIDIVVKTDNIQEASFDALNEFIKSENFSKYQYGDMVNYPGDNRPNGYIVNLFHRGVDGELWEMEIWFLEEIPDYKEHLNQWEENIGEEEKKDIVFKKALEDLIGKV